MYAKIKDGQLLKYPYGFAELQQDNPYTNFNGAEVYDAFQGTDVNLQGETLVEVATAAEPAYDAKTQKLLQDAQPTVQNGQWVIGWQVLQKTSEELEAQDVAQAASVRAQRNDKLKNCDWTQLVDSTADKAAWATYRQALRDITTQVGFPWTVDWPVAP